MFEMRNVGDNDNDNDNEILSVLKQREQQAQNEQLQLEMHRMRQTIAELEATNKNLDNMNKKLKEEAHQINQGAQNKLTNVNEQITKLQQENKELNQQINNLLQENFVLRGKTNSNLIGKFPTVEEILNEYVDLNEQVLANFYFDFYHIITDLPQFLGNLLQQVDCWCNEQYSNLYNHLNTLLFPTAPNTLPSTHSKLSLEIHDHLKQHYEHMMAFDYSQFANTLSFTHIAGCTDDIANVVKLLHSFFWKIKLTPQLTFAPESDCFAHSYNYLLGPHLDAVIIFAPVISGDVIVKQGYKM
jgi:hypothetical protein